MKSQFHFCKFRRNSESQKGGALLNVIGALAIVGVLSYVTYSRIISGIRTDFVSKAMLTRDSIFDDELKFMAAQGFCGIVQLQQGGVLSASGTGLSMATTFPISSPGVVGGGLSSETLTLRAGSFFDDLQIDNIMIGPFDYRFRHLLEDPTSFDGLSLKTLLFNVNREYIEMGSSGSRYLAMLYVGSHPRAEETNSTLITVMPVLIDVDSSTNEIRNCQSAFSRGAIENGCIALGGEWMQNSFSCKLSTTGNSSEAGTICAVNQPCNVANQYRF